jgi:hypothetical protein
MLIVRAFPVRSRAAVEEVVREMNDRADEAGKFYESFGIKREAWFYQRWDHGDLVIAVTQAEEPVSVNAERYAAAREGFAAWFKQRVADVTGVDPNVAPLGPPTDLVFDSGGGDRIKDDVPLIVRAYPLKSVEAIEEFAHQLHQRPSETRSLYDRMDIRAAWFVQQTDHGPILVAVGSMPDPPQTAERYASASDPFAIWFKKRVNEITGVNPERTPLGPETEKIFDFVG